MEFLLGIAIAAIGVWSYRRINQQIAKTKAEKAVAEARELNER